MYKIHDRAHFLMATPTVVTGAIGLILAIWHNTVGDISQITQIIVSALFIGLTGIPHGAIDHLVEQETAKRRDKSFKILLFLAKYLLIMVGYSIVWLRQPTFSLLFFIIISAWHFGETDIENAPPQYFWNLTRILFGFFVIGYILLTHVEEVTPVLTRISHGNSILMSNWSGLVEFKTGFMVGLFIFSLISYIAAQSKSPIYVDKARIFRLFIILATTCFLPLMVAFALYFGGWHALCAFKTIKTYIVNIEDATPQSATASALSVWSKTLTFSLAAFAFLGVATWYWFHFRQESDPLPPLFIFLSLITLPHLTVMHAMNKYTIVPAIR